MKLLVDNALSPLVAEELRAAGYDAVHVRDLQLGTADDATIFDVASEQGRIVVSADTDFATLLALRGGTSPSVLVFRRRSERRPADQVALLLANLDSVKEDLENGAIVVFEPARIRIRTLPILSGSRRTPVAP